MVNKSTKHGAKKGKVKLGNLKLNKETVKDLTGDEKKGVRGGYGGVVPPPTGTPSRG
jgi:hypothetical protein